MNEKIMNAGRRELLRHTVATLAYRGGKAIANAPSGFATFKVNDSTRNPGQILAHIGDLLEWALGLAQGGFTWKDSSERPWDEEVARFFSCLAAFDAYLASENDLRASAEQLFQGPIADALA